MRGSFPKKTAGPDPGSFYTTEDFIGLDQADITDEMVQEWGENFMSPDRVQALSLEEAAEDNSANFDQDCAGYATCYALCQRWVPYDKRGACLTQRDRDFSHCN